MGHTENDKSNGRKMFNNVFKDTEDTMTIQMTGSGGSSWSITFDNTDGWADEQGFSDEHCGNVWHSGPCTHSHSLSTPLLLQTLVVQLFFGGSWRPLAIPDVSWQLPTPGGS